MSRPAAAIMAAAGLRLRVRAPRATVEFGAVAAPERGGTAGFTAALTAAGRHLTGDVRVVVVSGSTWTAPVPAESFWLGPRSGPGSGALGWLSGRPDLFSVAVLHGEVSGPGLGLALACDLRVGADDTRLTWLGAGAGVGAGAGAAGPPSGAVTADFVALVGYARALEWSVVGAVVPAARAVDLGLLTRSVPRADVGAAADAVVDGLLAVPREAAVETKAALLAALPVGGRRSGD